MKKEIDLHRLRLIIRGALDYLNRDAGDINEVLTAQEKLHMEWFVQRLHISVRSRFGTLPAARILDSKRSSENG